MRFFKQGMVLLKNHVRQNDMIQLEFMHSYKALCIVSIRLGGQNETIYTISDNSIDHYGDDHITIDYSVRNPTSARIKL